jgi:hypothetical protein
MKLSTEEPDMAGRKKLLDEQSVAILAAGGSLPIAMGMLDTVEDIAKIVEKVAEVVVEVIEEIQEDEPDVAVKSDMASFFKAELSEANEKVITLSMDNREMKAKLETMDVTHTQLRAIAADAINLRNVGLGRGRLELSTASDEVLLSTYSNISKEFCNTFPTGGVTELASTDRPQVQMTTAQRRAVDATKI